MSLISKKVQLVLYAVGMIVLGAGTLGAGVVTDASDIEEWLIVFGIGAFFSITWTIVVCPVPSSMRRHHRRRERK